jgi:hypothetical protein
MTTTPVEPEPEQPEPEGDEPEPEGDPEPEQFVTTTFTKDFLGVPLVNAVPGTSQATDRLGRSVKAGNKDYLDRALVA